jgi:hypothetical protein
MYQELPLYQCFKKVRAAKIVAIHSGVADFHGSARLWLEQPNGADNLPVDVGPDYLVRCPKLEVGGYFVVYEQLPTDEMPYISYSPAEAFESGYSPLDDSADGEKRLFGPSDYPNTIETVAERRRLTALSFAVDRNRGLGKVKSTVITADAEAYLAWLEKK